MTIRCMIIAGWIPKTTNTNSEYVKLVDFLRQQRLHESASMSGDTYVSCLVIIKMHSVYCAVRTGSLNQIYYASSSKG
jgi:hypothetical protein